MDENQESSTCITNCKIHTLSNSQPGIVPQQNGAPEHRTLLRVSESHGLQLLSMLRSLRDRGLLFDFTIKVQDRSFACHRCVLAACSDFFRYLSN